MGSWGARAHRGQGCGEEPRGIFRVQVCGVRKSRNRPRDGEPARQVRPASQKLDAKLLYPCVGLALFHESIFSPPRIFSCRSTSPHHVGSGRIPRGG